jgi:hypothetical protein
MKTRKQKLEKLSTYLCDTLDEINDKMRLMEIDEIPVELETKRLIYSRRLNKVSIELRS